MTDVPPSPTIAGLPTSSLAGTAIALTGSATDVSPSTTAAGFDYLWSVSAGTGQQAVAGQDLTFNGSNPIALPSGFINGATSLTVDVTFETTAGGVILGYQNRALGTRPTNYVPALYVGTNGLLYAEIWNGAVQPITSTTKVNDGQQHTAVFTLSGSTETLTLDGNLVGTRTGSPQALDMTFDELGSGETAFWPGGTGGFDPFVGTLAKVQVTSGTLLTSSVTFPTSGGNQVTFTPPAAGTDTIGLSATDVYGSTGVTASNPLTVTAITFNLPTGTVQAVQGQAFSLTGSVTDPTGDSPYFLSANYGDGTINRLGSYAVTSFTASHAYADAGDYTVTLTFNDAAGHTAQAAFQVIVSGFTVNDGSPKPSMVTSLTYTFTNPVQLEPGAFELLRDGRPTRIHLALDEQPDQQTFLIAFSGPGVVNGSLPDGSYTLITRHKKVKVLSGPAMTRNDVNTFVRRPGDAVGDDKGRINKTDITDFNKRYTGRMDPPNRAPAKFRGRTEHHQGVVRPA